jgi:predicted Zn-dependent protease with MMP-like domain
MQFESVDISIEELDQLVEEAAPVLSEEANRKLRALVNTIKTVTELLVIGNLTIEKLRRLLGRQLSPTSEPATGHKEKENKQGIGKPATSEATREGRWQS